MWRRCLLWPLLLVSQIILCRGDYDGGFDVTTVYNIAHDQVSGTTEYNHGRIHSRANALGLALHGVKNKFIESMGSQLFNITCDISYGKCSWETKNWFRSYMPTSRQSKLENTVPYPFYGNIALEVKHAEYKLYFISSDSSRPDYGNIPIVFDLQYNSQVCVYEYCSTKVFWGCEGEKRFDLSNSISPQFTTVCCSRSIGCFPNPKSSYFYSFDIVKNTVKVYTGQDNPSLMLDHDFEGLADLSDITYFSVVSPEGDGPEGDGPEGDGPEEYAPSPQLQVLSAVENNAEMVSPAISIGGSRQLCLALELQPKYVHPESSPEGGLFFVTNLTRHIFTSRYGPFLQILAEDLHHNEHSLYHINNINYEIDWKVYYVNITVDKAVANPFKLKLRKVGPFTVNLTRIASCDPQGNEVQSINTTSKLYSRQSLDVYQVISRETVYPTKAKPAGNSELCQNGGVMTGRRCACPPGFNGPYCQNGCGPNRFGQDCGGICSLRQRGCGSFVLCTPYTSCQCAPGFQGVLCDRKCSTGWYGNDCAQKCGHCASNTTCDIYSGQCGGCAPGFQSPYCKLPNVYYTLPPVVSSPDYGVMEVSFRSNGYQPASEEPVLYQIQYRKKFGSWNIYTNKIFPPYTSGVIDDFSPLPPPRRSSVVSETIQGLTPGTWYEVRVLLMDANFNKYDGDRVQTSNVLIKCDIPETYDYKVKFESDFTSFNFSWTYNNETDKWCPVKSYEVSWKEDWQWFTENVTEDTFSLTGFLPSSPIEFKLRALTSGGFAPYSKTIVTSTQSGEPSLVQNLRVVTSQSSSVQVDWSPPQNSAGGALQYTITYKCVEQPACSPGCVNATEGAMTQQETGITLSSLLPFARYRVTVTARGGLPATIYVGTDKVAPTEVPALSARPSLRANTSLTVFWDPVPVCSSFLLGYNYQLTKLSDSKLILGHGFTQDTLASFHNLTASTAYVIKVFVATIAGHNPEAFLEIQASTSATVPEAVRNLTVYKRGRSMLGLRWAAPRATYGTLKSFTVTHSLGQESEIHTVEPTPCAAWPDLFCHTVEGLRANRKYNVTVSARNVDVAEDGQAAFTSGVTKEGSPLAPEQLQVVKSGSSEVEVQWRPPSLANGIIRSFVVSVEETERFDQDNCCQVYPLVETPVKLESLTYNVVLTGLQPASTYYVSVSAKTVGMGPSQALVVHTGPPHIPLTAEDLPQLTFTEGVTAVGQYINWNNVTLDQDNSTELYFPLVKARLLLLESDVAMADPTGILDTKLDKFLQSFIRMQFYFYSEYTEGDELVVSSEPLSSVGNTSAWGRPPSSVSGVFRPVAVRLAEYNGVFNADTLYFSQLQFS